VKSVIDCLVIMRVLSMRSMTDSSAGPSGQCHQARLGITGQQSATAGPLCLGTLRACVGGEQNDPPEK
jgi:hypothetical protein